MSKLDYINESITKLKEDGVYRCLPVNYGACTNVIDLNHKQVVNLSSNNYLGLANHPRLKMQQLKQQNMVLVLVVSEPLLGIKIY